MDADVKEELNPLLNGEIVRDISLEPSEFKENECEENFNESTLEDPFVWIVEDIDAPTGVFYVLSSMIIIFI